MISLKTNLGWSNFLSFCIKFGQVSLKAVAFTVKSIYLIKVVNFWVWWNNKLLLNLSFNRPCSKIVVILIFFCLTLHLNYFYQPCSWFKLSREYVSQNKNSRANLNVQIRVLSLLPFLNRVNRSKINDHSLICSKMVLSRVLQGLYSHKKLKRI